MLQACGIGIHWTYLDLLFPIPEFITLTQAHSVFHQSAIWASLQDPAQLLPASFPVFGSLSCFLLCPSCCYNSTAKTHNWVSWPSRAPWDGVTLFQHGPPSLTFFCGLDMATTTELQGAAMFIYGAKGSVDQHERVWACHLVALTALLCTLWHPLYAPQPGRSF